MIPGLNIISGKINIASVNRAGGSGGGGHSEHLSRGFRGQSSLQKLLDSKVHLHWFKIDFNVQD